MRYPVILILLLLGCAQPDAAAQQESAVAPFRSVALSHGGEVNVRHGAAQSVTVVAGQADLSVENGQLRISRCRTCPHRDRLRVEVVAPALDSLSVEQGGRIVVSGGFPPQAQLAASVFSGGALDLRALPADSVAASVDQGGVILTRVAGRLDAAVREGGRITYWGDPRVQQAIAHGGVVEHGDPADLERPIAELDSALVPPLPPVSKTR